MIFITGANGWLGLNLVKSIVEGKTKEWGLDHDKITVLILPGTDTKDLLKISKKINIIEGDLLNESDMDIFLSKSSDSILFHIAGIIHPRNVSQFYDINFEGTKKLIQSATKSKIKKMIIMSSNSPCGCNPNKDHLFDESSPYNPYMHYGRSKMKMELFAQKHFDKGLLDLTIIRSPWFYGPYQPPRQKLFFEMIRNGNLPIVGDGENKRSMAYVENIVQGMILSATKEISSGKTYWIADESPYTMNQIVDTIKDLFDKKFNIKCSNKRINLPDFISYFAEKVDFTVQGLGFYHKKIHVLSEMNKNIACSINLAKKELSYNPKYDLQTGMFNSLFEIYG